MASRLSSGTLTVTVSENLVITHATTSNNIKHVKTTTNSIAGVAQINSRIYTLKASTTHTLVSFTSDPTSGEFDTEDFKYMRITNLDDTDACTFNLTDTRDATLAMQLGAGESFIITSLGIDGNATGSAITSAAHTVENTVIVTGNEIDVEIVVATA
tara:strand:+ start:1141 stop:1611 length:471 start_codon:yes stop_codon:yes gene_type:complete